MASSTGIQPAPTHCTPTQTVNTGLYRLPQQLDKHIAPISGQACVQYPSAALGTCSHPTITDQYALYCDELGYF